MDREVGEAIGQEVGRALDREVGVISGWDIVNRKKVRLTTSQVVSTP